MADLKYSSFTAQYEEAAGHVTTSGTLTYPVQDSGLAADSPILNLSVDSDFSSRRVITMDVGPTQAGKDFAAFQSYDDSIPIYTDPGWLHILQDGLAVGSIKQPLWGGKVLLRHVIIKCLAGAVGIYHGCFDAFGETPVADPAPTRPFIIQTGGIFAQSFKADRPYPLIMEDVGGVQGPYVYTNGCPALTLQTYEDLNRIQITAFIQRYN
jgi:hypothetical protein